MAEPLKAFFDPPLVRALAAELAAAWPAFPAERFVEQATAGLDALELMPRARHIAAAMRACLPADYSEAVRILVASLGAEHDRAEGWGMAPFRYLPHVLFVAEHGLADFDASMEAQHALTRRFTAEFSLRVFVAADPERALGWLRRWAVDPDVHVRRLVSEGTRPRLPWAAHLRLDDHGPVLDLLELLADDPATYVRRSVANHLNDVWKDDPERALAVCRRWLAAPPGPAGDRADIVKHALRHAVKRGDPAALALLGAGEAAQVRVEAAFSPARPAVGDTLAVVVRVTSAAPQPQALLVDLAVGFPKPSGRVGWKVFKLGRVELAPGATWTVRKSVALRPLSTRTVAPGFHAVEVQVNGARHPVGGFVLEPAR